MPIHNGNCPMIGGAAPISIAAAGNQQTGWIDVRPYPSIRCLVMTGAGGGTPAMSFQQANTAAGGGAKALAGWAVGSYANAAIDVDNPSDKLDKNGGFGWIQVTTTMTGGAGTICCTDVLGQDGNAA